MRKILPLSGVLAMAVAVALLVFLPSLGEGEKIATKVLFFGGLGLLMVPFFLQGTSEGEHRPDGPHLLAWLLLLPLWVWMIVTDSPHLLPASLLVYPLGHFIRYVKGWLKRTRFDHA